VRFDPPLGPLLDRLHQASDAQGPAIGAYFSERASRGELQWREFDDAAHRFMGDKLVALDRDKAALCYQLCRALRARTVVEIGTSFGVSTLYLAAAVRANVREDGGAGRVIATELEPDKAHRARGHFAEAGLADVIELREGDLRQTLKPVPPAIDFVLMDIWTPMARPAIELLAPSLRPGAIVIADNTTSFREAYADYFAFLNDPANRFLTMTLPFEGGLELTVRATP
jgi:predicted O-methyltransferase YrrM